MNKKYTREYIEELSYKFKHGQLSEQEHADFEAWYQLQQEKELELPVHYAKDVDSLKNKLYININKHLDKSKKQHSTIALWKRIAASAAAAAILIVCGYLFVNRGKVNNNEYVGLVEDFTPGTNKAVLTLSDGRRIALNDAKNGQLAKQGGAIITKSSEGEIVYGNEGASGKAMMNTMSTPKGGQYHLTLADGTQVWLNAASSISYPTAFIGKERRVEITGEVYFEVAHNTAKPFKVVSKEQTIEVLGTHFNVNTYEDEDEVKTTLLEGSVKVTPKNKNGEKTVRTVTLIPGQRASLSAKGIAITEVDVNEMVAWKEGYFQFVNSDIQTIMRQVARWYNVDVEFVGPVTNEKFTGRISRFRNISQVLSIVKGSTSVKLEFEGRRIMVK